MEKISYFIKKVVISICLLYSLNLVLSNFGIIIPINAYSIILTTMLGIPMIFGILVIYNNI